MGRIKLKNLIKKYVKGFVPINVNVNNIVLAPNRLLEGKTAIVTDASKDVGKAIAKALIASGASVAAISPAARPNFQNEAAESGSGRFLPYACDVSDVGRIAEHVEKISGLLGGKIDILVNCASVKNGDDEKFFEFSPDDFDAAVDLNLKSTFFWCQKVAEHMLKNKIGGHIVNVVSVKGFIGEASPYSVSRWGVVGLTKGLGRMLAPKGIIVNGLAPGGTKTDEANSKKGGMLHLATPSMRLATPEEIANTAVFLASDLGGNLVGEIIISDGGQILQYGGNR